jgi:hypothetical protein
VRCEETNLLHRGCGQIVSDHRIDVLMSSAEIAAGPMGERELLLSERPIPGLVLPLEFRASGCEQFDASGRRGPVRELAQCSAGPGPGKGSFRLAEAVIGGESPVARDGTRGITFHLRDNGKSEVRLGKTAWDAQRIEDFPRQAERCGSGRRASQPSLVSPYTAEYDERSATEVPPPFVEVR